MPHGRRDYLFFLKVLIICLFFIVFLLLGETLRQARKGVRQVTSFVMHGVWARRVLVVTILSVTLTEVFVRLNGGLSGNKVLFTAHLSFAVPFLLSTIALNLLTGHKNAELHRVLGYSCLIFYAGTFVTGIWLIMMV